MTNAINIPPVAPAVGSPGSSGKPVWQLNQVLQAQVVGQESERVFTLRIGTTEMSARSDLQLTLGARLRLLVTQLRPEPMLKVVAADNATSKLAGADPATAATRQLLPRQAPMPPLFALLKAATLPGGGPKLPVELKEIVHTILERSPTGDLNASGIKRAISESGLFLEANLLKSLSSDEAIPEFDLKRLLLDLLNRLSGQSGKAAPDSQATRWSQTLNRHPGMPGSTNEPGTAGRNPMPDPGGNRSTVSSDAPPGRISTPQPQAREPLPDLSAIDTEALTNKLRQQAEGALARLTLHQVQSAKYTAEGDLNWSMEIPFLHKGQVDVVPLNIERRSRSNKEPGEPSWLVKLALDTPQFGPLHATILWHKQQVSSVLWAERNSTADLVRHHLDHLHDALTGQGLAVTSLECRTGKPPESTQYSVPQRRVYGQA